MSAKDDIPHKTKVKIAFYLGLGSLFLSLVSFYGIHSSALASFCAMVTSGCGGYLIGRHQGRWDLFRQGKTTEESFWKL
jgi:hypothetical protein